MANIDIQHDEKSHKFYVTLQDNEEAVLIYRLMKGTGEAPATIDFTRTYVPPEFRSQGIAEALVRRGVKWAREQNFQMTASCWYAAKFIGKDIG